MGWVAGRLRASPVSRLKRAPCTGQVIMQFLMRPAASGLAWCEQMLDTANSRPPVWQTSTQVPLILAAFLDSGGSSDTGQKRVHDCDKIGHLAVRVTSFRGLRL